MAPVAYFITFTTYGTWLHGRNPGAVDKDHNLPGTPFLAGDARRESLNREALSQPPYLLDESQRQVVLETIREVAEHRGWQLWAAHVRQNHVHLLITAVDTPEKVMSDIKAWASRRLRERCDESSDRRRWTNHGSTRWLNDVGSLRRAIQYVRDEQGLPMALFVAPHEPEA